MKQAVLSAEHQKARRRSNGIPQPRGDGRAKDAHIQQGDEYVVQYDIGHAARHGADEG